MFLFFIYWWGSADKTSLTLGLQRSIATQAGVKKGDAAQTQMLLPAETKERGGGCNGFLGRQMDSLLEI